MGCCNARDRTCTALRAKGRYVDVSEGKGKGVHEHANEGILGGGGAMQIHSCQSAPSSGRFTTAGRSANFPLNRRLCGPHSWSGSYAKEKDSIRLPGFEPRIVKPAESPQQFASPTITRMTSCLATYGCAR